VIAQLPAANTALLIVISLVAYKFLELATARFFKRTVETEYITADHCRECKKDHNLAAKSTDTEQRESLKQLGQSMDVLRGIVLVLAVRSGVDEKTLQDLVNRKGGA
jgi:hypothetical protein